MPTPALAIGLNARLFPNNWRPAHEEVAFAAANGFACLQFPGTEDGLDATRLGGSPVAVGAALRAAGLFAVMEIIVRLSPVGRTASGLTALDVLHNNLPAISALGCRYVHWHIVRASEYDAATVADLEMALLPAFADALALAKTHGFVFGFEHNAPGWSFFASYERCASTLAAVPGLKMVWDLNHSQHEDQPHYLALAPRLSMLHVSDTPLPAVNHHLPLGLGSVDLAGIIGGLLAGGFAGPAILEIGGQPFSGGFGRDTDQALRDSRQQLASLVPA